MNKSEQIAKVLFHSSIYIKDSISIYCDPFKISDETHDADLILITHSHYDHFSPEDIAKVSSKSTTIAMPKTMKGSESELLTAPFEVLFIEPGEELSFKDVVLKAIPAYNKAGKPFHPQKNKWVGYIITTNDVTYYIAGDTDSTKEVESVKCDIAFIPIGGTYTMNPKEAAKSTNIIKPKKVIPTHYGSIVGTKKDPEVFKKMVDEEIEVELFL